MMATLTRTLSMESMETDTRNTPSRTSSIYHNFYRNLLKMTGILIIASLTSATIGLTVNTTNPSTTSFQPLNKGNLQVERNLTVCETIKTFNLSQDIHLTICRYGQSDPIYIKLTETDNHLQLNRKQYEVLKQLTPEIDATIVKITS